MIQCTAESLLYGCCDTQLPWARRDCVKVLRKIRHNTCGLIVSLHHLQRRSLPWTEMPVKIKTTCLRKWSLCSSGWHRRYLALCFSNQRSEKEVAEVVNLVCLGEVLFLDQAQESRKTSFTPLLRLLACVCSRPTQTVCSAGGLFLDNDLFRIENPAHWCTTKRWLYNGGWRLIGNAMSCTLTHNHN